jgi:hypothetical protein
MSCRAPPTLILIPANREEEAIPPYGVKDDMGVGYMILVIAQQEGSPFCLGFPGGVLRRQVATCRILRKTEHLLTDTRVEDERTHPEVVAVPCAHCKPFGRRVVVLTLKLATGVDDRAINRHEEIQRLWPITSMAIAMLGKKHERRYVALSGV